MQIKKNNEEIIVHHQLISSEDPSRNNDHFQFYIIYSVQVQTQPRPNTSSGPRPAHTQWFQVNWKDTSIKEQISRSLSMYFWLISSYLNQIITEGLIIKKTQVSLIEILLLELLVHCKLKSCIIIYTIYLLLPFCGTFLETFSVFKSFIQAHTQIHTPDFVLPAVDFVSL